MKKLGEILWIDDNPDREKLANDLEEDSEIVVKFYNVKGMSLTKCLQDILASARPALVIIDHILDKTSADNRLFETGLPPAEVLRRKWPSCPIVGVTADKNMSSINIRENYSYDDLYSILDFETALHCLPIIARDFLRVSSSHIGSADSVMRLLNAPKEDLERLKAALPDDLKKNFSDQSFASRLYAWVDRILLGKPGFLYDQLWSATFLGIKESALIKVDSLFEEATYKGVFTFPTKKQWWVSLLTERLYRKCPPKPGQMPWEVGRALPKIARQDYSQCVVCKKPYPQTVAYIDSQSDKRQSMHLDCTVVHPGFKKELFFEEIRMMRGRK